MLIPDPVLPTMPSFLGWLGGKTKLRPTIINCIPPHVCYVEVFSGSATVWFGKPGHMSRIEILNDVHKELINLMKVLSGTYFDDSIREEFVGYVRSMPASREAFEDWKKWKPDQIEQLSPAQRAFRFYYCVKKGFSSVPTGGYEASPMANSRYNMNTDFEQFTNRFRERNAQIECMDFANLIDKYNRQTAKTFFFGDPPYFVSNNTKYYDFTFTIEDHKRLKKCCDDIDKNDNQFLITYDDVPETINLYKGYHIYRTDPIIYSAADERKNRSLIKTELFITNYDLMKMIHTRAKRTGDIFTEIDLSDNRIDIHGHIGLEKIQ